MAVDPSSTRQHVDFDWDEQFVSRIDEARGSVTRAAFVRAAVEGAVRKAEISAANRNAPSTTFHGPRCHCAECRPAR